MSSRLSIDEMSNGGITRSALLRRAAGVGIGASMLPLAGGFEGVAAAAGREQITIAIPGTPPGWDTDQDFGPIVEDMMRAVHGRLVEWKYIRSKGGGTISDSSKVEYRAKLVPVLATSWAVRGRTVTFQLRKGVLSHAGNPITAEDVRWSYERAFGIKAIGAFLNGVAGLKSMDDVKVLGTHSISFTLAQPVDIFLMSAALSHRVIWDSVEMKKQGGKADPYAAKYGRTGDGGCGRWKVVTVEPGNQVVIESFDGYFAGPTPIKRIVLKEVPSSSGRVALLSRGSVDMAQQLAPREYKSLEGKKGMKVWNFPSINVACYQLNPNIAPLNKVAVRQALAYAAPYDAIVNDVYQGYATRAGGPIPKVFPAAANYFSKKYSTDFAKAKALLAKAGASGFSTTIGYDTENPVQEQMAILFQTNLDQIGVKAQLKGMTHAAYTAEQTSQKTADKLPIVTYIDGPFVPHPYYGLYLNFYSKSPNNWSQTKTTGLDALLGRMLTVPNFEKAVALAKVAQQKMAEEVPWIFVAEPGNQIASRDYVTNVGMEIAYFTYSEFKA